jgi:hypothetical protein
MEGEGRGGRKILVMPISILKYFNFSCLFGKMMQCFANSVWWKKYEISQLLRNSYTL